MVFLTCMDLCVQIQLLDHVLKTYVDGAHYRSSTHIFDQIREGTKEMFSNHSYCL